MTPFESYNTFLSLKAHFNQIKYDYFKYGVKSNSYQTFLNRKDKGYFERLSKHKDPFGLILSNMIFNPSIWIGDLVDNMNSEHNYTEWAKRKSSLKYFFTSDLNKLLTNYNENFIISNGNLPYIMKLFLSDQISFDTLTILTVESKALDAWDSKVTDLLYPKIANRIRKYYNFIDYNTADIRDIVKLHFTK